MSQNKVLRLQSKGNKVFFADSVKSPTPAKSDLEQFMAEYPISDYDRIRIVCEPGNVALLRLAFDYGALVQTKVDLVFPSEPTSDPVLALVGTMSDFSVSLIREMRQVDRNICEFVHARMSNKCSAGHLNFLFQKHPLYPVSEFLPGARKEVFMDLACRMFDIRRFHHRLRPERHTRLYSYLRVGASTARAYLELSELKRMTDANFLAYNAWYSDAGVKSAGDPAGFLYRVNASKMDPVVGLLVSTRKFLTLCHLVWEAYSASHPEVVFQPDRFFRPEEAAAWCKLLQKLTQDSSSRRLGFDPVAPGS